MSPATIIQIIVYVLLAAFLVFRLSRERKFPMATLWIWPAVLIALVTWDIWATTTPTVTDFAYMILALLAGGAFGWYLGIHSTIRVDKPAGVAFVKSSPIGIVLFVAALGMRWGARFFSGAMSPSATSTGQLSPAAAFATAITLVFAVGLFIGLRLYVKRAFDEAPA